MNVECRERHIECVCVCVCVCFRERDLSTVQVLIFFPHAKLKTFCFSFDMQTESRIFRLVLFERKVDQNFFIKLEKRYWERHQRKMHI